MPQHIPEEELISLLKSRDKRGFDYLYKNYSYALFGIIHRIIADEDEANDVLQDAFIKIWQNIDNYASAKGRFFTWMLNLTRNLAIDKLRSANYKYHNKNLSIDQNIVQGFDQNHSNEENVDTIGLRNVVGSLREEYKILIELSYFTGHTQAEIAEMLDIPLGTVKTRLRAAISQLREKFN